MDDELQDRLRHLFPRVDVLTAPIRLQLSELLATPGTMPALTADEVADLPLPAAVEPRQGLRLAIEKDLTADALAELHTLPFADVIPLIQGCAGGPRTDGGPVRLCELLKRMGPTTWTELGPLTLGEMAGWHGMGPGTLTGLIGVAVGAALANATSPAIEPGEGARTSNEPGSAALGLLLRHDTTSGGGLRRALEAHASSDGPADVRAAAAQLLAAADRGGHPRLELLDRIWQMTGDHRDRTILFHRALRLDRPLSSKELAATLGLSENRVSQIHARAARRARDAATAALPALGPLVGNLGARLGLTGRLCAIDEALAVLGLPQRDDPRSALLIWLAGPYLPVKGHAGWFAAEPATLLADTRRLLQDDGGVRQRDHVAADLCAAGLAAQDVEGWLAEQQGVVVVDGLMVALSGSPADVAERLLSATGRAMTATDLAEIAPQSHAATVIDQRLRRDPRFVQVDRERFELAEWGGEAWTEPPTPTPTELFPRSGRSQLRVEVDTDVLRGATDPVPFSVVEALGLPCGGRRTFTTRFGPVALNHRATEPIRGSIRPIALAMGATEGDVLLLEFDAATGDASVELVVAASSAAS